MVQMSLNFRVLNDHMYNPRTISADPETAEKTGPPCLAQLDKPEDSTLMRELKEGVHAKSKSCCCDLGSPGLEVILRQVSEVKFQRQIQPPL